MDNLEYFDGIVLPTMSVDGKESSIEGKDVAGTGVKCDVKSTTEPQNADTNRLPMPPSTTNLKAISAAALVASRRKVMFY